MTTIPTPAEARAAANRGMQIAADHAGQPWQDNALAALRRYLRLHETMFVDDLWDVLPPCDSDRALGSVIQNAARQGWMAKLKVPGVHPDAFVARPSVRSNGTPKPVWRSALYGQQETP
jgi:hypothetical protein